MEFDWANQTEVHPIGLAVLVVLSIMIVGLPRRYACLPLLMMACAVSSRQRIVILDLDWTFLRLLVLAGWIRMLVQGDLKTIRWIPLDKCVMALAALTAVVATLRTGEVSTLILFLGVAFDSVGMYLLFRAWIRSWRDVIFVIQSLVVISIPVAAAFWHESQTGRNIFHIFGGVPEITVIREGRLRCQGPFSHAILAGSFWACLLPLFVGLGWAKRGGAAWAVVGSVTALMCIVLSASSTPIAGVVAAVVGGGFFFIRKYMRVVRWSLLVVLIMLHLVMEAPVWHLISRIDLIGGSTGWHRFFLIDNAVRHVTEWFILGIGSTAHWGHMMHDVTNEFLIRGFRGGFAALCLFVAIVSLAYQGVGRICRMNRRRRGQLILGWAIGVSLFTHTTMFFAVSYFGQILMVWGLLLAMIGSIVSQPQRQPSRNRSAKHHPQERSSSTSQAPKVPTLAGELL